jgi:hypothetical protein
MSHAQHDDCRVVDRDSPGHCARAAHACRDPGAGDFRAGSLAAAGRCHGRHGLRLACPWETAAAAAVSGSANLPTHFLDRFDPFSTALDPYAEPPDELQTKIDLPFLRSDVPFCGYVMSRS